MDTLVDKKDYQKIIGVLEETFSSEYILNKSKELYPGWIVEEASQGSSDLASMNLQWALMCRQLRLTPQKVLLVQDTFLRERKDMESSNHKIILSLCDNLSRLGFMVRDKQHFDLCTKCKEVILCRELMEKNNHLYTGMCGTCSPRGN